ncbi:YesL family protein [Gracilibacillus salinarum]|uniref:DUF624 domain-containing protein n=1 Tax=Gracilibacillus salinarum TaxID=2932255 RepID=A0ABY4GK73_9BACI|nr:DUF624 domain-containing protein [Gracilibacillus salinarum]UOQ84760.1 DUF624 domain-containing protein [Gracilibacillus salinarum]
MKLQGLSGGIYSISLWISRLAILNVLWILGVITGLVIIGFAPATVALYTLLRRIVIQKQDVSVIRSFLSVYKKQFVIANKYGLPIVMLGVFLYLDFLIAFQFDHWTMTILQVILISLGIVYIMITTFLFSVQVHYEVSILANWKNAFILAVLHPLTVITNLLIFIIIGYITLLIPGLLIFFSFSIMALVNVVLSFHRLERHDQQMIEEKA